MLTFALNALMKLVKLVPIFLQIPPAPGRHVWYAYMNGLLACLSMTDSRTNNERYIQ